MACIFCRFLAWLHHKVDVRAKNKAQIKAQIEAEQAKKEAEQAKNKAERARNAARNKKIKRDQDEHQNRWRPPPIPLPPPEQTEDLEFLRARIPPRSHILEEHDLFRPPPPTSTVKEACKAAANAVAWPVYLATREPEYELVAARAVRAVAAAISTSRTYPVCVAVVTMAESAALIEAELGFTEAPPGVRARRQLNALNAAVDAGMAAYHEENPPPPNDGHDIHESDSQTHTESGSDFDIITESGSDSTPLLEHTSQ